MTGRAGLGVAGGACRTAGMARRGVARQGREWQAWQAGQGEARPGLAGRGD
jgi:hypothetical protein